MDSILVTKPIGSLYCVVHVPPPVILMHTVHEIVVSVRNQPFELYAFMIQDAREREVDILSERSIDTTLRRHRMTSGREKLRYACGVESSLSQTESGPKTCPTSTDNDSIVLVILGERALGSSLRNKERFRCGKPTMTGYLLLINGEASLARSGWFATIRAV